MSTIPSNPPYSDALRNMMETNLRNISDEKFGAMIQAQATLAVAWELHTANLIALAQMEHRGSHGAGFSPDYDAARIYVRMGTDA